MDSLSSIHAAEEPSSPEPFLPPAVLLSPIHWTLEEQIHVITLTHSHSHQRLLGWEAQKGKPMFPPPCDPPFWAPFMLPRALDTQAASVLSRSYKIGTGGPVWPRMSPNLLRMLSLCHLQISSSPPHRKIGTPNNKYIYIYIYTVVTIRVCNTYIKVNKIKILIWNMFLYFLDLVSEVVRWPNLSAMCSRANFCFHRN